MAKWNGLPVEGRGSAPVASAAVPLVDVILYRDPLSHFHDLFGRLCVKRSSNRIEGITWTSGFIRGINAQHGNPISHASHVNWGA
jgi:hypothetical protein